MREQHLVNAQDLFANQTQIKEQFHTIQNNSPKSDVWVFSMALKLKFRLIRSVCCACQRSV